MLRPTLAGAIPKAEVSSCHSSAAVRKHGGGVPDKSPDAAKSFRAIIQMQISRAWTMVDVI